MTIVNVVEPDNAAKYLIITQQKDPSTLITTRVVITDNANNTIKLVDIQRGLQGETGPMGPQGPPGQNAISFEILPIVSGGTNNSIFTNDKIIYYDGNKLSSSNYSVNDLLTNNTNTINSIIVDTGLSKIVQDATVTLSANLGDGLAIDSNNNIVVDNTIPRKSEITLGAIDGTLGIFKGGTNNSVFNVNRLVYFDGSKLTSFPLDTGRIVTSGSSFAVVAGSGLMGGGDVSIPGGSVIINIGSSEDIFITENSIALSVTGIPGTYTKVVTDTKGRVVSGTSITQQDILDILGYVPWHPLNDGDGSGLDADLLDGQHSSYYRDLANLTGTIRADTLPINTIPGIYSKVSVGGNGLVLNGSNIDYADVVSSLGYRPVSASGDVINGDIDIFGSLTIQDNLPVFANNSSSLLANDPRGFSFVYGDIFKQTGILAYYPADNQLKLITKIFTDGANDFGGGDSSNGFAGEIDGGDSSSVYLLGNLDGDTAIVLLQHIADQRYVSLVSDQIIKGIKTFDSPINIKNYISISQGADYIGAPIFIGSNSGLVNNFNSDLLDNNHGSYYRDAYNLTGTLDYNNTIISNISGNINYLSRFDNRTIDPSRTISPSILKQSGENVIILENGSFSVGDNSFDTNSRNTVAIGFNNDISGLNGLAVGTDNVVIGKNSLAINSGSQANAINSFAMGSNGTTWLPNQLSIGAFEDLDTLTNKRIGLGQHSTTAIGYRGDTNGNYASLSPTITIPENKTILYNIDLLFAKFGSSGTAAFSFSSGIVKNITGTTYVVQHPTKSELYNNSQIRDYLYTIQANDSNRSANQSQILSVLKPPLQNNSLRIQNLPSIVRIRPELSEISGYFSKTFDGKIALTMHKPISSGSFVQTEDDFLIRIQSYNHNAVTGCIMNINYISGINSLPLSSGHAVQHIYSPHELAVSDYFYNAHYNDGYIDILNIDMGFIDNQPRFIFSGTLQNGSNTITACSPSVQGVLFPGMSLSFYDEEFVTPPKIVSVLGSTVTLDTTYYGAYKPETIFKLNNYSYYRFLNTKSIFMKSFSPSYNLAVSTSGELVTTPSGIKIGVSGYSGPAFFDSLLVCPTINNSGSLICTHKRTYNASFERDPSVFKSYTSTYTQYRSVDGYGLIDIQTNNPISSFAANYNPYIKFITATNSFSGVLTSGSNIITECLPTQVNKIFSGMILSSSVPGFAVDNSVATTPTSDSIVMSLPFTGITTTGLIVYSGALPPDSNYYKTQDLSDGLGIQIERVYESNTSGAYVTGQALLYTDYGYSDIVISPIDNFNISNNDLCYLQFITNNNGTIPVSDNYYASGVSFNGSFSIQTKHLMPGSGVQSSGFCSLCLDRDHGYLNAKLNYLQQIPLSFSTPPTYTLAATELTPQQTFSNPNRTPKNGIFDILAVTGDTILINDSKNYLIKENSSNPVYDALQQGGYQIDAINNSISLTYNKNYFIEHDEIYCIFNENNTSTGNFRIIDINHADKVYDIRPVSGLISESLPNSGTAKYIGSISGFATSPLNNMYFHSYGGISESWGRDYTGKYIDYPLSGFFIVYDAPTLCQSGTLCIHISGISNFTSIKNGDTFYFDFIDMEYQALDGIFSVNEKISNNIFTLSIPYNFNYIGQSGLVHLIDGLENIKTNKYPNYNNVFSSISTTITNSNIHNVNLYTYNDFNNRWKHALSLRNNLSPNKYEQSITVSSDSQSDTKEIDFLVLTPYDLTFSVLYSVNNTNNSYQNIEDNTLSIQAGDFLKFKILVQNGAGYWSNTSEESAPRVNILGIADYQIIPEDINYNPFLQQWEIVVTCGSLTSVVQNKNIIITVSDESGRATKNLLLNVSRPLIVTDIENTEYGYIGSSLNWRLLFEVYGGNISPSNPPSVTMIDGQYPDFSNSSATIQYLYYPSGWYGVLVQGLPGVNEGIFEPVVLISDGATTISKTGILQIRPGAGPPKSFAISPRAFSTNVISKYDDVSPNTLSFILPVDNFDTQPIVTFTNMSTLNISNPVIAAMPNLMAYSYKADILGAVGYYNPIMNIQYDTYSFSTDLDITVYNDISINTTELVQPLQFDINRDWSLTFRVDNGVSAHRSNVPPKVYLNNTPNIGVYDYNNIGAPLEYSISYAYNSDNKYWIVSVTGKKDLFGESAVSTGNYIIGVYAEDSTGYITNTISTNITGNLYLVNANTKKYATPNNGFEFNVDIAGASYNNGLGPTLIIPSQLTESLISPTRTYYAYDPDTKIWEASYMCSPLTEKWDASVSLIGNNLSVKAKGILNDKLYIAGRVSAVETDSAFAVDFKPLKIIDLNPSYTVEEGSHWQISFKTEGGLEDNKYPPQIQLYNLPTSCTGYDPRIPDINNNNCFLSKTWNPGNKQWSYVFKGQPLCLSQGQFNIDIIAIDRINDTTFGTASADTEIIYEALGAHPGPTISSLNNNTLYPQCQSYQEKSTYKINVRDKCPRPTGISGVLVWGSLPPGLEYSDSRAGEYASPYSDLTGGNITIYGVPNVFANGGNYPELFNIAVFDARGNSGVLTNIQFKDGSSPIACSPVDISLYFAQSGYINTPALGSGIIKNENQTMLRPPVSQFSMQCTSRLPHSQCAYSTGLYSVVDSNTINLSGQGTTKIYNNNKIYVEFDNQIDPLFNQEYLAIKVSDTINITRVDHGIDPTISGLVKILNVHNNVQYVSVQDAMYQGSPEVSPILSTTTGILGGGEFKNVSGDWGFVGRMKPNAYSYLTSGIYDDSNTYSHLDGLTVMPLDSSSYKPDIIAFSNCYETGYFRVSGIILPHPSLEASDRPPGGGNLYSSNNQSPIGAIVRTTYGDSDEEKANILNARAINNINYAIYDIINNKQLSSGNLSTSYEGIANLNISIPNLATGTVYSLYLQYLSNVKFPTYDRFAIPSLSNVYYWTHKGGNQSDIPTETAFPPLVPVDDKKLLMIYGVNTIENIQFAGSYFPNNSLYYPYGQWSNNGQYAPYVTGYIQEIVTTNKYTGTYSQIIGSRDIYLSLGQNSLASGDAISIKFNSYPDPNYGSLPFSYTGIIITGIIDGNITIANATTEPANSVRSGTIECYDIAQISSGYQTNQIKMIYKSSLFDKLSINSSIDLINCYDTSQSINGNILPSPNRLSIISGTNTESYLALDALVFSGTLTSDSNMITNCNINLLNRLPLGVSLYSPTHSLPYGHQVTAVTADTITLNYNYTGPSTNNVLLYYSGYDNDIFSYYSGMLNSNGSGLCEIRKNLFNSDNLPHLSFGDISYNDSDAGLNAPIIGIPSISGSYIYRIMTSENPNMPIISDLGWKPKKYGKDFNLTITTPLSIVTENSLVNMTADNSWSYSFAVTGGYIPKSESILEVEVNGRIHTFTRSNNFISDSGMVITINSRPGFNWSTIFDNPVTLRVYDETGSDEKILQRAY